MSSRSIKRGLVWCLALIMSAGLAYGDVNVLIVGSSRDSADHTSISGFSDPFPATEIRNQLNSILAGAGLGPVNVVLLDRSAEGHSSDVFSLAQWFYYPYPAGIETTTRWPNLRGERAYAWDYVIVIGDPYTMEYMPGVYAHGVGLVGEEVAKGTNGAETVLLMPWPESKSKSSVAHYKEVVYRAGRTGGYKVAPAGLAWAADGAQDTVTPASVRGAYICAASIYSRIWGQSATNSSYSYDDTLANNVYTVVTTNMGAVQYSGKFTFQNPYLMLADPRRDVHFSERGSSTESWIKDRCPTRLTRCGLAFDTASYSDKYSSNTPEDDGGGWPTGRPMPIAWNGGRSGLYTDVNAAYWQIAYQWHHQKNTHNGVLIESANIDDENDQHLVEIFSRDLDYADEMKGGDATRRNVPFRLIWGPFVREYPNTRPVVDNVWHMHGNWMDAISAYMVTLYTGRCPLSPVPSSMNAAWWADKVGYETAWRVGNCSSRAPGFRVRPSSATATNVTPSSAQTLSIDFVFAPKSDVTVLLSTDDTLKGTVTPSSLTFTPANYATAQNVTVLGESGLAGSYAFNVELMTASSDAAYHELSDSWEFVNIRPLGQPPSDIRILGNGLMVISGDTVPHADNGTDFGATISSVVRVFTITNRSDSITLNLTGSPDRVTLADATGCFSLQDAAVSSLAPGETTTFEITYSPVVGGVHTATVSVASSDPLVPVYTFVVGGLRESDPTTTVQGTSSMDATSVQLTGVLSAGGVAEAWIVWGTADAGTINTGDWDNVVSIGSVAEDEIFSCVASSLAKNTTYFYRCYVTNSFGTAWSDSAESFSGTVVIDVAWTPKQLSNTIVWLDAADTTTLWADTGGTTAATTTVARWDDKSGNSNHMLQATVNARPLTANRTIGGLNAIDFDGNDDKMQEASNAFGASISNAFVFMVIEMDRAMGNQEGLIQLQSQSWETSTFTWDSPDAQLRFAANGANIDFRKYTNNVPGAIDLQGRTTLFGYYASEADAVVQLWVDAVKAAEKASVATVATTAGILLGQSNGGASYEFDGRIAEVVIIDGTVSQTERQEIEGYLAWKWGMAYRLPIDHPYKSVAPSLGFVGVANLAPTGITSTGADLNASLNASATNCAVYVYYGTTDGGTNAGSWDTNAYVGSWTNVLTNVSYSASLEGGTTNYYAFMASNTTETVWASPSWQFTTPANTKTNPTVNAWPTTTPITYGQTYADAGLSGGTASVDGTFSYNAPATVPNAGTNAAAVRFTPDDTANYNTVASTVNVVVSKASPSVTNWPSATDIQQGQAVSNSVLIGGSATVPGTFSFDNPTDTPPQGTNTVNITFTPADTANYVAVGGTTTLIVTKVKTPATVTLGSTNQVYNGSPISVTTTTDPLGLTVIVTYDGSGTAPTDAGSYAVIAIIDDVDYAGSTSGTLVINKATPSVTWPSASTITVGQAVSNAVFSGGSSTPSGGFSFDDPSATPSAGTYGAAVTFTPDDASNWLTAGGTVNVTVLPLPPAAPAGLAATSSVSQVMLDWTASSGATSYSIKRSDVSGSNYVVVGSTALTSFTNSPVANGAKYYYVVSASNAGGEGANSAEVVVTLQHVLPFAEDFESLTPGDLDGQNGWAASDAVVQTNIAVSGKAARITSESGYVEHGFAGSESNVWTDLKLRPVFVSEHPDAPADTNMTAVFYVYTNGHPVVFNGTNRVELSAVTVTNDTWVRLTVESDYTARTWNFFVDGALVATNLGFYNTAVSSYESLTVKGGGSSNGAVDDVSIGLSAPFGEILILTVNSDHGAPHPYLGTTEYVSNSVVSAWISDTSVTNGLTNYVCTGWTRVGSNPGSGTETNTTFTITNDTTLTWQWKTNYYVEFGVQGN